MGCGAKNEADDGAADASSADGSSSGASSSGGSSSGSSGGGAADDVTQDDVVDLDDLLEENTDAAGAVKVGKPSTVLLAVGAALKNQRAWLKAVVARVKAVVTKAQPDVKGKTVAGQPFGVWKGQQGGVKYRFIAVRTKVNRLRYSLYGSKDGATWKGLMTGIFVKKAPRKGGGRLHMNLTNITDLVPALNVDGKIHLWFANAGKKAKARRVVYRKVKKRKDHTGPAWNFGADYVRKIGVGGRARTLIVGDIAPKVAGIEGYAARIGWLAGKGGRGVAVYGQVHPAKKVYAVVKECWGPGAKNTYVAAAWKDPKADKGAWAAGGDKKACVGDEGGDPPESSLDASGHDKDPEADAAFKDEGASDVSESDADKADDAKLGDG